MEPEFNEIFYHRSPSKRRFRNVIHGLLQKADAKGRADIIYRILHYLAGQASLVTSQSRQQTEYLIKTDSIIVRSRDFSAPILTLLFSTLNRNIDFQTVQVGPTN